jgi:hypothetical protein
MATAKLKMVESRSPERQALAEAIDAHASATKELQACHDAISQASFPSGECRAADDLSPSLWLSPSGLSS